MLSTLQSTSLSIPTLNAEPVWDQLAQGIATQGLPRDHVLIIDSSSDDKTFALAQKEGYRAIKIPRTEFSHGGTRQLAVELRSNFSIQVFMTQDAILKSCSSIANLVGAFDDPRVGAAFGRQLPRHNASPIEAHARLFNYPPKSAVSEYAHRHTKGFKAIFISNAFAAYRTLALNGVHGFPSDVIFGEDTVTAARVLKQGWLISYVAEAEVVHSHSYSLVEEFRRYFDIGVLHSREASLIAEFGEAAGEGHKFVCSELYYLLRRHPLLIPSSLARTALKLAGYGLGRNEHRLATPVKRKLSMHRSYWTKPRHETARASSAVGSGRIL